MLVFGWNFLSAMVLYWAVQAVFSAVQQYFITGWGSLSDIFPFLPAKVEKVRELKPMTSRKQSNCSSSSSRAWRRSRTPGAPPPAKGARLVHERAEAAATASRPDGRPVNGSTLNISGNRQRDAATAHAESRCDEWDKGTNGANGTNRRRAAAGHAAPSTTKAIGAQENPAKMAPPVPRRSKSVRPAPDSTGEQTGGGGST